MEKWSTHLWQAKWINLVDLHWHPLSLKCCTIFQKPRKTYIYYSISLKVLPDYILPFYLFTFHFSLFEKPTESLGFFSICISFHSIFVYFHDDIFKLILCIWGKKNILRVLFLMYLPPFLYLSHLLINVFLPSDLLFFTDLQWLEARWRPLPRPPCVSQLHDTTDVTLIL